MAKRKPKDILEDEVAGEILQQLEFAKRYLDPIHQRMNDQEELYRSYINNADYPHNAQVFDPRVFRIIETVTPRMVASEPMGSFYPAEGGDTETTEILNTMMKYDWAKNAMFEKLVRYVKSMLIFGTAFGRVYWDYQEDEVTQMQPQYVNGKYVWSPENTKKVKRVLKDNPNFEPLNIYDCFPDPNSSSIDDMRWFIFRRFRTLDELKAENEARGMEYYKNLDKLEAIVDEEKDANNTSSGQPVDEGYREHRRIMLSTEELHGQDPMNPEFVILRRYEKDRWVDIVADHGIVIRDCDNPYFNHELPIIYCVDYTYPGELYGIGEIEPVERIQRAINAVLNQRLDNVQLVLRNMWKVKKNGGVDLHTLFSSPGNVITTDDMNAVQPLSVPDVTGATFVQTMNYLTASMQNGSGITDYTIGIDNASSVANKTATGTRLIQQEANAQFKLKIQMFNHMVIKKIADYWKDLRIQFTTEEQKIRIVGKDQINDIMSNTNLGKVDVNGQDIMPGDLGTDAKFKIQEDADFAFLSILPEDIQPAIVGDYDFMPAVSSEQITDQMALTENFFVALDTVKDPAWAQGLAQQGKILDYSSLTEKVFEKLNLGIDSKEVLQDVQELQQAQSTNGMTMGAEGTMGQQNPLQNPAPEGNMQV